MGVWVASAYQQNEIWLYGKTTGNKFCFKSCEKNAQKIILRNPAFSLPYGKMDSWINKVLSQLNENW